MRTHNLAILASGAGTNAENLAKAFVNDPLLRVRLVLTNKKDAGVLRRMHDLGIDCLYIPNEIWDKEPDRIIEILSRHDIEIIALAGFLRYINPDTIDCFRGRIVNIHPSLLPAYGGKGMYGHKVHEAVIANGERTSGATVHIVTEKMDEGKIIAQKEVEVLPDDTPESLEAKVHAAEYEIYPLALRKLASSI